jgi:endonuclease-3 related protein
MMDLHKIYEKLLSKFVVDNWWPAESQFEIMVGAILTQQTTWEKVEEVIRKMKARSLLNVETLASIDQEELERVIMPVGFYRQKAERIKRLATYLQNHYNSDPSLLLSRPLDEARNELLTIKGIGKETADAILLYAGKKGTFVAAKHCCRVLMRTGLIGTDKYDDVKRFVEQNIPPDPEVYAKLYALLVQLSKTHCRNKPQCQGCPLEDACPFNRSKRK